MLGGVVRAIRLLCILQDLQERPRTAGELADRYGVSARTIRRDLVVLQAEPMYASLYKEGSFWCYLK